MNINVYRVTLINADLLAAIGATCWHIDVAAHDMSSAWRKFAAQRKAPAYRFSAEPASMPEYYDIALARNIRLESPRMALN